MLIDVRQRFDVCRRVYFRRFPVSKTLVNGIVRIDGAAQPVQVHQANARERRFVAFRSKPLGLDRARLDRLHHS